MGDSTGRTRVILTDAELPGTEKVLLELAHRNESGAHASLRDTSDRQGELDDEKLMGFAEWIYLCVE